MPNRLYRNAREYFTWPIAATDEDGDPVALTSVDVTFVASSSSPSATATYFTVPVENGKARVLLAGPDAPGSGATVLPLGGHVPWFRLTDSPEVIARPGPRIYVS